MTRYNHLITDENRRWWTLGAMCFALFMIMLDNTVVNVALPSIQRDLGSSVSGLEWVVNGYTLSFAVLLATGGRLGDIFGRRRAFLIGVVVFTLSSMSAGFATETWQLVASRVVQGAGAAFMMPATLSIITDAFDPSERGKAIGTWAGVSALALGIGPVLGGFLTENVSWQSIFYINVPVGIAAVLASLFAVRESRDRTVGREVDYAGVATLTIALTALVLALVEGNSWGWSSPQVLGLLGVAAVVGVVFVLIEQRVKAPMIEFPLFASRDFVGSNLVAFVVSFSMLGMFFFLALYMQGVLGFSPLEAGIRFLPTTLMIVLVAPVAGRLTDRIGPRWLITGGLSLVALSLYFQTQIDVNTTYADLWPLFVLMGVGIAMTMSPMSTAAMNAVATSKAGIASGLLSMSRMVGGTFGVAAIGALFQARAGALNISVRPTTAAQAEQAKATFVDALSHSMRLSTAVAATGAVIAAAMIRSPVKSRQSPVAGRQSPVASRRSPVARNKKFIPAPRQPWARRPR